MKFNLAISILIHESPSFFEVQIINIRHFYPNAIIVVHVNEVLWNTKKTTIINICKKYNILINPKHYVTNWATSSLFDAIMTNITILQTKQGWTHYIFLSSNELFVSDLLEKKCTILSPESNKACVWDSYSNLTPLEKNVRDFNAVKYDQGLINFVAHKMVPIRTGLDFGRVISKLALNKIEVELNIYWKNQRNIEVPYSQSEVVLPTIIEYLYDTKQINLVRDICFSTWITNYIPNSSEEYILVKKIPRDKHSAIVKGIMSSIGITYRSNVFHRLKSKIKNQVFLSKIFYKQREVYSNIVGFFNS